jgi:tRNA (guanine-N7-)-methyltransferase
MAELWPRFGVEPGDRTLDFAGLFGRVAPVVLEIGFGNGETLAALAVANPEADYLGIEVYRPGVGGLLRRLAAGGLANVRVMAADAKEVLARQVPDASLAAVHLFFPDPWPKKRHHKRRLVQSDFVELVSRKLMPGGVFHLATDWQDYAHHMMAVLSASGVLENVAGAGRFGERGERPPTKFERRGARLGHGVWDLIFRRRASQA